MCECGVPLLGVGRRLTADLRSASSTPSLSSASGASSEDEQAERQDLQRQPAEVRAADNRSVLGTGRSVRFETARSDLPPRRITWSDADMARLQEMLNEIDR